LIVGAGVGVAAVAAPLYAAELAPARLRGRFVSAYQLAITVGIFLAYQVDAWLSASDAWRIMLGASAVPGLLLFAVALVAPESPRWLMKMHRRDDAARELRRVRPGVDVEPRLDDEVMCVRLEQPDDLAREPGERRGLRDRVAALMVFADRVDPRRRVLREDHRDRRLRIRELPVLVRNFGDGIERRTSADQYKHRGAHAARDTEVGCELRPKRRRCGNWIMGRRVRGWCVRSQPRDDPDRNGGQAAPKRSPPKSGRRLKNLRFRCIGHDRCGNMLQPT